MLLKLETDSLPVQRKCDVFILQRTNVQVLLNYDNVLIAVDRMRFVPYAVNFFRVLNGEKLGVVVDVAELPHPPMWDSLFIV